MTTSFLKHLDYTDDICSLSHRAIGHGQTARDLEKEASRVGLKINTSKSKVLSLTGHRILLICINGQSIEIIDLFVYLGSVVSAGDGTELDVARGTKSA